MAGIDNLKNWRSSWIWLLGLFTAASFAEAVFYGQMSAFTPLYLPELGVSQNQVAYWTGLIVAISSLVGIPFLPFWGALADRYARQPVIVRSYLAHLLAAIISLLAQNVWIFVIGRSMMSFSLGNSGLMMATLLEHVPDRRHGLAFSIMNSAAPVGAFAGPLLGGPIVDHWGFRTLLVADALLMLLVILVLTFGYRDQFKGQPGQPLLRMALDSVNIITRSPRLRTLFPAQTLLFAGWMMAFTYVPLAVSGLYTGENLGFMVGLVMGAGGLAALFLSPLIGALGDRHGLWHMMFASTLLEILLWPIPAITHHIFTFTLAWTLLNGVGSAVFALSFSVLARSAPIQVRGRVMSFAYLPLNIGSAVGPAIGSVVTSDSVFVVFPVAAAITALGMVAMLLSRRQPAPDSQDG